jgi:two-component system, NtrC family, response regulator
VSERRLAGRSVLLVDDERDALDVGALALRREGCLVETASTPSEALDKVRVHSYDAAVLDLKMPEMSGIDLLRALRGIDPDVAVVMVTGYATIESAVEAVREGASDYLPKPFTPEELRLAVRKAIERQDLLRENQELRARLGGSEPSAMLGESEAIREVRRLIARVADTDATVLVLGETGTGKELAAREIHTRSRRASGPFIPVDCAAVPAELLESEFFGHEKGAFTGAVRRRKGSFELAHGGTLFLDEIGNMGLELQSKLLRALQEREIQPVGSERRVPVDVRIVAATNRDLVGAMQKGGFREDLYYRLNVVPLTLPPLRERSDDVPLLVGHFLAKHGTKLGRRIDEVSPEAMTILAAYSWPGNVRELESAVERAMTLAEGPALGPDAFRHLVSPPRKTDASAARVRAERDGGGAMPPLAEVEKEYILEVLQATHWNRREASRILGISTVTLWRRISGKSGEART